MKYLLILLCLVSCTAPLEPVEAHHHGERLTRVDLQGEHSFRPTQAFRQVGLIIDGPAAGLRYQVRGLDGALGPLTALPLTWSEGEAHVGRILLAEPAVELILMSAQPIEIHPEFWHEAQVDERRPLARDLPRDPGPGLGQLSQGLAPRELVIPREEWGARNPGLICNNPEDVYRISVHHTASPENDGGDPAVRMRQIQAYHMDNNGWCDIGYHFVVSQSGLIYEARRDERAPAAHVGNQNSGNVGICFIGNYENAQVPDAQFAAGARILGWVRSTHGVPANRDVIRGHQQWPGQQTACPGRNLLNRLDELIALTEEEPEPPPPPPPEEVNVTYASTWIGADDFHTQGSSAGVSDLLPGQRLQLAFQVSNQSPGPLRGVRLGYGFPEGVVALDYVIQTDWPARDQQTWQVNDADMAPENPPKDQLGPAGELTMYAFGAGETKRVLVTLEAGPYRGLYRPEVQGFVSHIDGVYEQPDFDAQPGLNTTGRRLAEARVVDLLSPSEWSWPAPEPDDHEGFLPCGPALLTEADSLYLPDGGCALSPAWTRLDADRWDSLVLELSEAPPTRIALWWKRGGEDFDLSRALTFEISGPGPHVLPLEASAAWTGLVDQLQLTSEDGLRLDHLWPQSRARRESGSTLAPFLEGPLATVLSDETPPPPPGADRGVPDLPIPDSDAGIDGPDTGNPPTGASSEGEGGCTSTPGQSPGPGVFFGLLLWVVWRRHQRA